MIIHRTKKGFIRHHMTKPLFLLIAALKFIRLIKEEIIYPRMING
jgi:hypothetical protein